MLINDVISNKKVNNHYKRVKNVCHHSKVRAHL